MAGIGYRQKDVTYYTLWFIKDAFKHIKTSMFLTTMGPFYNPRLHGPSANTTDL